MIYLHKIYKDHKMFENVFVSIFMCSLKVFLVLENIKLIFF
jgi:hypothetical protein